VPFIGATSKQDTAIENECSALHVSLLMNQSAVLEGPPDLAALQSGSILPI